jgi:hypothetical protein
MTFILFQRGATCLGFQIGRLYLELVYPSYWLYYGKRQGRKWFFNYPAHLGWEKDN